MFTNSDEVLKYIKDNDVKFVDVRFCDLPGIMQHFTTPAAAFSEQVFTGGLAFDGSSIRGFQEIHESDMLLLPDATTAVVDPFRAEKTLNINFFIHDPLTHEAYSRDPRNVAKKAEAFLKSSNIADTAYFGAEAEFYIFDSVRYDTTANQSYYYVDSESGAWNSGREEEGGNLGYKVRHKGGYFPVAPYDHYGDLRDSMVTALTGVADTSFWGSEAEFYIFDDVRYDTTPNGAFYAIDSVEGAWNSGKPGFDGAPNLGYKPRYKGGYFPVPPTDHFTDLRSEMVRKLIEVGIDVEMQHHEVGTAGQSEIDFRFGTLLKTADNLMLYKYVIKSTAMEYGHTVTFMPKPIYGDNGSGMHCHQSLWKDGAPLFYDEVGYAGLSDTARYYIGGLLKHAPSL